MDQTKRGSATKRSLFVFDPHPHRYSWAEIQCCGPQAGCQGWICFHLARVEYGQSGVVSNRWAAELVVVSPKRLPSKKDKPKYGRHPTSRMILPFVRIPVCSIGEHASAKAVLAETNSPSPTYTIDWRGSHIAHYPAMHTMVNQLASGQQGPTLINVP